VRNIAIRIGFFVLIGVGALVLRPFLAGGAGDLKIGECFDEPAVGQTVEEVQHHPCTEAHSGEVFFVGQLTAAKDAPFPAIAVLEVDVATLCVPAFNTYTGLTLATDTTWTLGYIYPLSEDWADGDRDLICYAARYDETPTNTSIKKT
jgi:hypothetical protein